jgi:hypothetical protein
LMTFVRPSTTTFSASRRPGRSVQMEFLGDLAYCLPRADHHPNLEFTGTTLGGGAAPVS